MGNPMKYFLVLTLPILVLMGCTSPWKSFDVQRGIEVDPTKKTMTVPSSGEALFEVKEELRKAGWKLKISVTSLEEEQVSPSKRVTELNFGTAYRLNIYRRPRMYGFALFFTVVENRTNEMVLEVSAFDMTISEIVEEFVKELERQIASPSD
jgi:hypothetical protein